MPHALFLGSQIATVQRYALGSTKGDSVGDEAKKEVIVRASESSSAGLSLQMPGPARSKPRLPQMEGQTIGAASSLRYIHHHIKHASIDIAVSLVSFALVIK